MVDIWNIDQVLGWIAWREDADMSELQYELFTRLLRADDDELEHWCDTLTIALREGRIEIVEATWQDENGTSRPLDKPITKNEWSHLVIRGGFNGAFLNAGPKNVIAVSLKNNAGKLPPNEQYNKAARAAYRETHRPINDYPHLVDMRFCSAKVTGAFPPSAMRAAYEARAKEFMELTGRLPPLEKNKAGDMGDREWAAKNGVSRSDLVRWRAALGKSPRGRPKQ